MVTSEQIFRPPIDGRIVASLALSVVCTAVAIVSSFLLAIRHLRAGQAISGTITPVRRSVLVIKLILACPVFATVALFSLVTVEVNTIWMFLLTLVLCNIIGELPSLFLDVAGGPVRLQLAMKEYRDRGGEKLRLYGSPPLCCIQPWAQLKVPDARDLPRLRAGIEQFTIIQPILAFVELFLQVEGLEGASFVALFRGRKVLMTVVRVLSNLTAMSSMRGLGALVAAMSSRAGAELHLAEKQKYGQSFLMGMHLLPAILHGIYLWLFSSSQLANGYSLTSKEQAHLSVCVVICLATLLCARTAQKAFPVDSALYPELEATEELAEPMGLHHVRYCPFCGSRRLCVLAEGLDGELLECAACLVGGVPLRLPARRRAPKDRSRLPGL